MHVELLCHYSTNPESRRGSSGGYTATAAQTRRVDRAAAEICMRSYSTTAAQTRRVDRGAVEGYRLQVGYRLT